MDPKFQSSFIPKASVIGENKPKEKLGLLGVLAVLVFSISILLIGGVFVYKKMTQSAISGLQADIASEESTMDKAEISKIIAFDNKIKAIKGLINNHVAVSQYFKMLEENTVSDVQFLSVKYSSNTGEINIDMRGKASGYASIADQDAVLHKNPNIISPVFDSFALDTNGGVNFALKFKVKGDVVKFGNLLQATNSTSVSTSTSSKIKASATSTDDISAGMDDLEMPDISNL